MSDKGMSKSRIEAFSDGVIAIIITIMVLEMKVPHGGTFHSLLSVYHIFLCYALSFIYLGIYWNNHHHLFQAVKHVNGAILWANAHLLFWLSLIPFTTGWMGENHFAPNTVAVYGFVLLMSAIAYFILVQCLLVRHGRESTLAVAIGDNKKERVSVLIYIIAMMATFFNEWIACALYVLVAIMWLAPDRRIEKVLDT